MHQQHFPKLRLQSKIKGWSAVLCLFCLAMPVLAQQAATRPAGSATGSEDAVRVMTFNIRYNNPGDGPNAWPHRKEMAAGIIRFHQTDLAGLQEARREQIADLEERLPEYDWFGVGREDGQSGGEFCPIFYRRDRFNLKEQGTFWLSSTPDQPSRGWDASFNRVVTWGRFEDRQTTKSFFLFNTHFDHRGETARQESAKLLRRKVAELAGDAVYMITGDFNATPESQPYRILTEVAADDSLAPFIDARQITRHPHHGPKGTSWGFRETCVPDNRIDYIFVHPDLKVYQHGHLSDTYDGRHPSDHLPVLAEIAW